MTEVWSAQPIIEVIARGPQGPPGNATEFLIWDGDEYPERVSEDQAAVFVGPEDPDDLLLDGDAWVDTAPASAVTSVNTLTGAVVLNAASVGAKASSYVPAWSEITGKPSNLADIDGKLATTDAPELIRDTMGAALVAGANITLTVSDVSNTITIAASGTGSGAVDSVNGQTGVVVLTAASVGAVPTTRTVAGKALSANVTLVKADVGLGSVDNTADSAKNVSTATRLTTPRTINGIAFDGSANISIPANVDLTNYARKSFGLMEFYDIDFTTDVPSDRRALIYDGDTEKWTPVNIDIEYAGLDSSGRLDPSNWQKYYTPTVILDVGQVVPVDFPVGGLVFERPAPVSLVPSFRGSNFTNTPAGATLTVSPNAALEVGEWICIVVMTSAETTSGTLPTTISSITPATGAWTISSPTQTTAFQSGTIQVDMRMAKVTTLIPSGNTITMTLNQSRGHRSIQLFRMPNLAAATPWDRGAINSGGSGSTLDLTVGPTAATQQASEIGMLAFAHNDASGATTRVVSGTNSWAILSTVESDTGSVSRTVNVLYRVYTTAAASSGTVHITASDGQSGAWAGVLNTFRAG